jgi:hypothetical protein
MPDEVARMLRHLPHRRVCCHGAVLNGAPTKEEIAEGQTVCLV